MKNIYINEEGQKVVEYYDGVELVSTTIIGIPKSQLGIVPSELRQLDISTESGEIVHVGIDDDWNIKYIPPILAKDLDYVIGLLGEREYYYRTGVPLLTIVTLKDLFWSYNWNVRDSNPTEIGELKGIINFQDPIMKFSNVVKYEFEQLENELYKLPYQEYMEENLHRQFKVTNYDCWGDNRTITRIQIVNRNGYERLCDAYIGYKTICASTSAENHYYGRLHYGEEENQVLRQIIKEIKEGEQYENEKISDK